MFGEEKLEALVLGARWVKGQGDPALAGAADSALGKIATALPRDLRDTVAEMGLCAPRFRGTQPMPDLRSIREAIRRERKLNIFYVNAAGKQTQRTYASVNLCLADGTAAGDTLRYVLTQGCADDEDPIVDLETPGRHPSRVGRAPGGAA